MIKTRLCNTERNRMNEDYIKGIRFLLKKSREQGVNVRKVQWVPHVSKMLSEHDLCYKFWYNVWKQNSLYKIPLCNTWFDVMYDPHKYLFSWDKTLEHYSFWYLMLGQVLKTRAIFNSETRTSSRRLCDGDRITNI